AAYEIPDGVKTIRDCAFYCSTNLLKEITIPASVTTVGTAAFYFACPTDVIFEGSVPSLGTDAFSGVYATCYYPANDGSWTVSAREAFGDSLTWQSYYPTSGTCGENLTWTLDDAYVLTISGTGDMDDWNYIGDIPWNGHQYDITAVVIEEGVTSIGSIAFRDCYSLTSVSIPDSVTSIGRRAFGNCYRMTGASIPDSVAFIGDGAFEYCEVLESVTIPTGVTAIGSSTFECCYELKQVTVPEGVTAIGDSAFAGCIGLTDLILPDTVTTIGSSAFQGCSGLKQVSLPANVASIGVNAFSGCRALTEILVDSGNTCYTSLDGVLFNKEKTELITYPAGKTATAYGIPAGVETVGESAFSRCSVLTEITIPDSVMSIGEYAFSFCSGLIEVTIPDSVASIGESAFSSCSGLTKVTFEGSAPANGNYVFSGVSATCYYPASDPTWTEGRRSSYGGSVTWVAAGSAGYEPAVWKNGCYEISNASQLYWFANFVNAGNYAANGRLTADIVLNNGDVIGNGTYSENTRFLQWVPIAKGGTYSGVFDGNGHTVSGLYYYCKNYTQASEQGGFGGMFNNVSGKVHDLTVDNALFYHYNVAAAICNVNSGEIENCSVTAYISADGLKRGGVAYQNTASGSIENCHFRGRSAVNGICETNRGVISGCSNYGDWVSLGICSSNYGTLSGCVNYADITGGERYGAGICGSNSGTIADCENHGEINGLYAGESYSVYRPTGGICGSNSGVILRCANTGEISSPHSYTGGICGQSVNGKIDEVVIRSCYNTGAVYCSETYSGGIVGYNDSLVIGCYNTGAHYSSSGSICGYNGVSIMRDGSTNATLYKRLGTVANCISYYGSTIIESSDSGAVSENNYTASQLYSTPAAYVLNGFNFVGEVDWYQNIDNGQPKDTYAVLDDTHGRVYVNTNTYREAEKQGWCGDLLEWALDDSGTLTITGSGGMDDFIPGGAPWYPWREEIRRVIVEDGTSVGAYAFYNCTALNYVDLNKDVYSVGRCAFARCTSLESFYYGDEGGTIGNFAFYGCTALKKLAVPAFVTVSSYAFEECTALNGIWINSYAGSPEITAGSRAFMDVTATVYYPQGSGTPSVTSGHEGTLQFQSVTYGPCGVDAAWSFDADSGTLTVSGTGWPQEYFSGNEVPWSALRDSITAVAVEEGITGISDHLFEFLRKAERVTLPDSLTALYYTSFNDCSVLNNLLIPASVTSMGNDYGFIRCGALTDVYYLGTAEEWAQVDYSDAHNNSSSVHIRLHCLTLQNDNPPTCTQTGTEPYYAFDDRTVYSAMYDENKQVITHLATLPATGHTETAVEGKAATCTEAGLTDGVFCPDCDSWLTAQETIPATNHRNQYAVAGKAATCTETGLTDGVFCPDCDSWLTVQETVPLLAHTDGDNDHICDSGCGERLSDCADGEDADHKCDVCQTEGISQHRFTEQIVADAYLEQGATCETAAVYRMSCRCGEAGTETFSFGSALGHDMGYRVLEGELYYACGTCWEGRIARGVTWNGQGLSVTLEAVLQPTCIYAALYGADGQLLEVRMVTVTEGVEGLPISFEQTGDAAYAGVFFVGEHYAPWLKAVWVEIH
ncbi:MAG: leucine-rich repeat protein, partial [Clostridia bacterium]|nr:leucine-rich repeat protein [Clostridia bacterium]